MAFDRITPDEISQNGVVSAPDRLTGTAADNKAIFDKLIKNIVAREFNKLLDDLEAATGAASIGAAPFGGVEGKNIQDQLKNVQSNVSASFDGTTINGHKIPGTVVITKGDVGLGNVDNTSDAEKPVSSPQRSYVESVARDFILGQLPVPLPITQGGTNADTPQKALSNLGAGVRPNLLDNWDFRAPVNQRGDNFYNKVGYSIDRWKIGSENISLNIEDGYVSIFSIDSVQRNIWQKIGAKIPAGTTITASAVVNGDVKIVLGADDGYPAQSDFSVPGNLQLIQCTYTLKKDGTPDFYVQTGDNSNITKVYAVKLEIGRNQTLSYKESDGTFEIIPQPDGKRAQMLSECQRYQIALWRYFLSPAVHFQPNYIDFSIPVPVEMRSNPVLTQSDFIVYTDTKGEQNDFVLSVVGISANAIRVRATKEAHGLTLADGVRIEVNVERAILDANL